MGNGCYSDKIVTINNKNNDFKEECICCECQSNKNPFPLLCPVLNAVYRRYHKK